MNTITQYLKPFFLAASLTLCVSIPVLADDTEVYSGGSNLPSTIRPNLTFIFDTSGSMDGIVTSTTTNGEYDPSITYTGDCSASKVYWSRSGTPPDCTGSSSDQYFNTTVNHCSSSTTALATSGYATAMRLARYRVKKGKWRWRSLSDNKHDQRVECAPDWGNHGETNATNPYPADGNDGGPWTNTAGDGISWTNTSKVYTLYSANYLNWLESASTTVTKSRLQIVQDVFSNLIDSLSENVNLAVMRFDGDSGSDNKGGFFVMPMQQLTKDPSTGNAAAYKAAVNAFDHDGSTPLAETLYEAYLFYRGDPVKFGDDTRVWSAADSAYITTAGIGRNHADVFTGTDYDSPIEYQCQKNFVILLTDGDPRNDTDADNNIESLPGFSAVTGASSCSGNCLDELADYMFSQDCRDPHLDGRQNVITYTIGFNTDQVLLSAAASKGGGSYYTANDTSELTNAFTAILTEIMAINTSFIAPAVSVNAFNRFTHRDELYYAIFKPDSRPRWDGNVKRFKLDTPTGYTSPIIVDKNGNPAVNVNTGFFDEDALSFWTDTADLPTGSVGDGDEVSLGGAASRLTLPRTIYTYTDAAVASEEDLTSTANALHEDNTAITKTMLGNSAMTDLERSNLLQWARGVDLLDQDNDDAENDIRRFMGDPLHAKPRLITYGGTDANPDMTLYVGTNEGHLMAINTTDGSEVFTFIPQELLPNLNTLLDDNANVPHPYGMDGPLTAWFNDLNGNGLLYDGSTLETGEYVYLYQGMRRGGSNYYSLDVTDRSLPKLKWIIKGGSGDFSELGQTWSAPSGGKIKVNGVDKTVLIFGGGYDVSQDDNSLVQNDTVGRAIYMVDASTGQRLWWAGPTGSGANLELAAMTNSIPSDVRAIDTNYDGYIDRLYVGDMRAQVWRFDLKADNTGVSDLATGGVIARLGDTSADGDVAADNRRFYYAPDASLSEDGTHINIAIGSGYRAHPLNTTIHDGLFMIRDTNVEAPAVDGDGNPVYTAITLDGLYDATANLLGEGTTAEINTANTTLDSKSGLYMWLKTGGAFVGEKVLAKSFTYNGLLAFTTFTPVAAASSSCAPSQGTARLYLVNPEDLTPIQDNDATTSGLTKEDRSVTLVRGGIPPEPTVIFHKDDTVMAVGTELPDIPELSRAPNRVYWHSE